MTKADELPSQIPLTIADAIHNLRCALDHMTWELVGWDGGAQNRYLKFPTGEDRPSFEGSCDGIKTPSGIAPNILKSLEAFRGGRGHSLHVLNSLNNADKHETLTPIASFPRIKKLVLRDSQGKIVHTLTNLSDLMLGTGESMTIDTSPEDTFFNFDDDAEISPDILFGKVKLVKKEPVIPTLAQLRDATLETIKIVEASIR